MEKVPYLGKFETKRHQILDPSLSNIHKVACRILFESRVNRHVCNVINFINKRHFEKSIGDVIMNIAVSFYLPFAENIPSMKGGKDQESIQSSTTPGPRYHVGK